jgi:hypothetical protein
MPSGVSAPWSILKRSSGSCDVTASKHSLRCCGVSPVPMPQMANPKIPFRFAHSAALLCLASTRAPPFNRGVRAQLPSVTSRRKLVSTGAATPHKKNLDGSGACKVHTAQNSAEGSDIPIRDDSHLVGTLQTPECNRPSPYRSITKIGPSRQRQRALILAYQFSGSRRNTPNAPGIQQRPINVGKIRTLDHLDFKPL